MNANSSTTNQWLSNATAALEAVGVVTARLDCLVLLEDELEEDRSWLLAHPETVIQGPVLEELNQKIERRSRHEPLAYIRGKAEFYGREFTVNPSVLVPRPESETIITTLKKLLEDGPLKDEKCVVIDVGTGSGALGITAKLELPENKVSVIDIDPECLKVAQTNAQKHDADVTFFEGDLLQPLSEIRDLRSEIFLLLCNLPYVPDNHPINEAAVHEPKLAIFGGMDGLDLYRKLFSQIDHLPNKPRYVLCESLPLQHHTLAELARKHNYIQSSKDDFIQTFTLD